MPAPKHSFLHPGVPVNIVLKSDQPTGKLTAGIVKDILTKGDHPHGVKVRLTDGRVGRVQSIRSNDFLGSNDIKASTPHNDNYKRSSSAKHTLLPEQRATSLEDYIITPSPSSKIQKAKAKTKREAKSYDPVTTPEDAQTHLSRKYPNLDTALIAAILADYPSVEEVERVLDTLSSS